MEFTYAIGMWGIIALIVGAVVVGVGIQLFGEAHFGYEWLVTALGAGIAAFVTSEFIVGFRAWEPLFDGLALVPAILGGLVVGVVVAAATRFLATDTFGSRTAA
jgi:hypothetical protein